MHSSLIISVLFALVSTGSLPAAQLAVKMATQAPENSPWHTMLLDLDQEWQKSTDGRVSLVIYPGGVSGDESDIIRKMRIGQLHAGALSVSGLTDLDESFSVFQIPLFFDSWDELNHVLDDLTPVLVERLRQRGFIWLTWGHVGWVHFFTNRPVARLDDLRELKIFTWAGDDQMVQWWKRNGFRPVALALPDALQGLKTGMIDTMISPPLAAMTLQWFREAPYMIDIGLAPMVGALVLSERAWEKISEGNRAAMLAAAASTGERLQKQIPLLDQGAINIMSGQGLEVLRIREGEHAEEWLQEARAFAAEMRGDMVPASIFDRALRVRDEYRRLATNGEAPP